MIKYSKNEAGKNIIKLLIKIRRDDISCYYRYGVEQATTFHKGRYLVSFNQSTGDLITGDKRITGSINKFLESNRIGGQKWSLRWSKK